MRFSSALTLGLVLVSGALAGQTNYTSIKGVREFTGQLIVRPLQIDALVGKNWTLPQIQTAQARAKDRLKATTFRYHADTDEYVVKVPSGKNENTYATELLNTGDYQYATPNWRLYPVTNPNDSMFPQQWHHQTIKSPFAWSLWTGGANFPVTFVDTGITKSHPDLKNLLLPGYNSVDRKTEAQGGDISDINGHGTHVSGCGAAQGNNGLGVSGVGWNFKIRFVKTSNDPGGGASFDDILTGARWAADQGSKTISASYSGVDFEPVGTTGTYIKTKGALFLYAAGNDNRDLNMFTYPDTIVCGASNEGDGKAGFSAYGKGVSVFAPGTNILSTTLDGAYGHASGTSMATPVTNGALAAIWSVNPTLTPTEAQQILYNTCDTIGSSSIFGHGRINVYKGVVLAMATLARDTDISAVAVQSGSYSAGNLTSVRDADLGNAYRVNSINYNGIGAVAGTNLEATLPTDQGPISSYSLTAKFKVTGTQPATAMAYLLNLQTNNYDMIATKGTVPGLDSTLSFRLTADAKKYVNGAGKVKMIIRSIVPSRFGAAPNQFILGHAKVRYSIQPTL